MGFSSLCSRLFAFLSLSTFRNSSVCILFRKAVKWSIKAYKSYFWESKWQAEYTFTETWFIFYSATCFISLRYILTLLLLSFLLSCLVLHVFSSHKLITQLFHQQTHKLFLPFRFSVFWAMNLIIPSYQKVSPVEKYARIPWKPDIDRRHVSLIESS